MELIPSYSLVTLGFAETANGERVLRTLVPSAVSFEVR